MGTIILADYGLKMNSKYAFELLRILLKMQYILFLQKSGRLRAWYLAMRKIRKMRNALNKKRSE